MSDYTEPTPEPAPAPAKPAKKEKPSGVPRGKMSEKQKKDLAKHMAKHKEDGMSASEMKSHRMKMMSRMRKGMSVNKAHKDIGK